MFRSSALSLLLLTACTGDDDGGGGSSAVVINYIDSDGDTIIDLHEGYIDPAVAEEGETSADWDADATFDYLDEDSDADGVLDKDEAGDDDPLTLPWDTDGDGSKDFRDLDADGNCIPDADEPRLDSDEDGFLAFADVDDDGDGIGDTYEMGAECALTDTDADGTPDYLDTDSDGDGVKDVYEAGTSDFADAPRDADGDGTPDYRDLDSDGDGYSDTDEGGRGNEPRDTDEDGVFDFADADSDGDGLSDSAEAAAGTDAYDADTDSDGYTDGAEVEAGTSPTDPASVIEGLYVTVSERTTLEETFEFSLSVQMGDIAFLLDTTCSMTSTLNGVASEFSSIISSLSSTLPDAQYGVATFDDYAFGSYGSAGTDKPFELVQQVTASSSAVQSALSSLRVHYGGDGPEGAMEALYQGLTGAGYDQGCDGRYTSNTDVKPFMARGSDPFGGSGGEFYNGSGATGGGFGFRDYALPIVVYATDNYMRDPDSTNRTYNGSPGGCPLDGGSDSVIAETNSLGATLIGIAVSSTLPTPQMTALANSTNSLADTDGDGRADDVLVFSWSGSGSSTLRNTIVNAITDAVSAVQFDNVSLTVAGDENGFVSGIEPESYSMSGSPDGETVEFTLTFRGAVAAMAEDQVFLVTLNVVGDDTVLLDTLDIYVVVPGSG